MLTRLHTHPTVSNLAAGYLAAANVWGLGMFLQMLSYAALARELGWNLAAIMASTASIWGLPGQIAMIDLLASGASMLTVALAVMMSNARMAAMTVSTITIVKGGNFFTRLWLAQMIGITGWLYTQEQLRYLPPENRQARFIGFYGFQLSAAWLGNIIGFYASDMFDSSVTRVLVFISPLFLLLVISVAKNYLHTLTAVLGSLGGMALYPYSGVSAIVIAGLVMGTLGWLIAQFCQQRGLLEHPRGSKTSAEQ